MAKRRFFSGNYLFALGQSYLLRRVLLIGVFASLVLSSLFSVVQSRLAYSRAKDQAMDHVRRMEGTLEPQLELALWNLDTSSIQRALSVIAKEPHVAYVSIEGSGLAPQEEGTASSADWTTLQFPLEYESKENSVPVGLIRIGLTTSHIFRESVRDVLLVVFYNFLEFLVISLIICFLFHQQVTKQILEIERFTEKFNDEHLRPILGASLRQAESNERSETKRLAANIIHLQENFQAALRMQRESEAKKLAVERQLEQERQKLKLMQRLHSIGKIATHVVHDFANLMLVIRGNLGGLKRQLDDTDPRRTFADEIDMSIERAYSLVSKILKLTRVQESQPQPFNPNTVVREIAKLLHTAIGKKISLDLQLSENAKTVVADQAGLENALINLCVNARDAMPAGGKITIETVSRHRETGEFIALSVRDTGPGVPPEIQDRIFDPFFTTKAVGKGSGLGLAQVSEFCRESNGAVELSSSPGGAVFTILLPFASPSAPQV